MDKRTKILASGFGAIVAYLIISSWVYPTWVQPLVTLKDRVAESQETLDKLEKQDSDFQNAKREYRRLVERVGALDLGKAENALRVQLDALIAKHKLEGANVSPSRGTADKSGIERMNVSINAVGPLQSVVGFMQDVAELPQLIRVGNVTIYPASSGKRNERTDKLNMRLPIEVLVLPQQKMLGEKMTESSLKQPEKIVRHSGRDFSHIWNKTPFIDFVPLPPLVVSAGAPQTVPVGQSVMLQGSATGGDGRYTYEWDGDGLSAKDLPSVPADTSTIGRKNYTLVVKDGSGNTASAKVTVTVTEPPPPQPLVANAGQPQSVHVGQSLILQGSATGGDGTYTYTWSGDGIAPGNVQTVPADTSTIGQKNYTLVVKDGSGASASAQVTITVEEPPPQPKVRNNWTDRNVRQVAMTLETKGVPGREGELLVVNQSTRERTYHAVGEDFDGGKLVYVDTRGGIVKWDDKYSIYPLGAKLDQEIPAESATNHPDLLRIVERLKLADAPSGPQVAPEVGAPTRSPRKSNDMEGQVAPGGATPDSGQVGLVPAPSEPNVPADGGQVPAVPDGDPPAVLGQTEAPVGGSPSAQGSPPEQAIVPPPQLMAGQEPAVAPVSGEGMTTQPVAPGEKATEGAPAAPTGEANVPPPAVKDTVKERPSRAKSRRPPRPKPAAQPAPASEDSKKDESGQKQN